MGAHEFQQALNETVQSLEMTSEEALELRQTAMQLVKDENYDQAIAWLQLYLEAYSDAPQRLEEGIQAVSRRIEDEAATRIQSVFRGYLARKQFAEQKPYLICAQRVRNAIQTLGMTEEDGLEFRETVQSLLDDQGVDEAIAWVDLYVENMRNASERLAEDLRKLSERFEAEEQATVKIQSFFRSVKAQREARKRREDITRIQAVIRGALARQQLARTKKFLQDQQIALRDIDKPTLRVNEKVSVEGATLLKWFQEATRAKLPMFWDTDIRDGIAERFQAENLTIDSGNWCQVWAQLRWKDSLAQDRPDKFQNSDFKWLRWGSFGPEYIYVGKNYKGWDVYQPFGIIGRIDIGGRRFLVEEKMWVKPEGVETAHRYTDLAKALHDNGNVPAHERATNIRKVLQEDYDGVDDDEFEAALAMFGSETARNPRSYGIGLMLLDLVEDQATYGTTHKPYTWDLILASKPHTGELKGAYRTRKSGGTRSARWGRFSNALNLQAPQFNDKPVESLWAGKWPMSPSASMSLGGYTLTIPARTENLNVVQFKEAKLLIRWCTHVMKGIDVAANNLPEAKVRLMDLFNKRLDSVDRFTNAIVKSKWT
jgi:hypothetical protein